MESNIIKKDRVVINEERDILADKPQFDEPQIMVHKKDGIVESIDIICTCGREIHIVCEYRAEQKIEEIQKEEIHKTEEVDR